MGRRGCLFQERIVPMTKDHGSRRDKPSPVRMLNEETETEKYKRLGWDAPLWVLLEKLGQDGTRAAHHPLMWET
jgi:hypothetical protein